jgi:DNA replication protein DnaC
MPSHYDFPINGKELPSKYDYNHAMRWLEIKGKEQYGKQFKLHSEDTLLIRRLLCYFLSDEYSATEFNINLDKGILLTGPIGVGKSSLMNLMRLFEPPGMRCIMKPCRDVSFEFIQHGYQIIHKYSRQSFRQFEPITYCFDDLGTENSLKYFGNECNVMGEILLSRYDLFISRDLTTHLTTNLSASEIEAAYGNRVRSRMREMFNLIAFNNDLLDKRT